MTSRGYIFAVTAAVLVLLAVITLLRQHKLRERHAIWWLVAGTIALLGGSSGIDPVPPRPQGPR